MYLSRLILNPRNRYVRRDLANANDLHRTLLRAFPPGQEPCSFRAMHEVLYRMDVDPRTGVPVVLLQSRTAPDWSFLDEMPQYLQTAEENPSVKSVGDLYEAIRPGQVLRFCLQANVTKKILTKTGPDGKRNNGKRVPLRKVEEQVAWLRRKGQAGGFELLNTRTDSRVPDVRLRPDDDVKARRKQGGTPREMTFGSVRFEGKLRVTDEEAFLASLINGIGSGKAYGFGLLSVASASRND